MTLRELLALRRDWADDDTIYATEPWSGDAEALISNEAADSTDAIFRSGKRYAYFLEGFIARDFLDDLGASADDVGEEACDRLIRYAIDDACAQGNPMLRGQACAKVNEDEQEWTSSRVRMRLRALRAPRHDRG
jgi:hypothetical protein